MPLRLVNLPGSALPPFTALMVVNPGWSRARARSTGRSRTDSVRTCVSPRGGRLPARLRLQLNPYSRAEIHLPAEYGSARRRLALGWAHRHRLMCAWLTVG